MEFVIRILLLSVPWFLEVPFCQQRMLRIGLLQPPSMGKSAQHRLPLYKN